MRHTLTFPLSPTQLAHLDFVGYAMQTEDFSDRPVPDNFETIDTAVRLLQFDDVINACDVDFNGRPARLESDHLVVDAYCDERHLSRVRAAFTHFLGAV